MSQPLVRHLRPGKPQGLQAGQPLETRQPRVADRRIAEVEEAEAAQAFQRLQGLHPSSMKIQGVEVQVFQRREGSIADLGAAKGNRQRLRLFREFRDDGDFRAELPERLDRLVFCVVATHGGGGQAEVQTEQERQTQSLTND